MPSESLIDGYYLTQEEKEECEWLDSQGFTEINVSCDKCGKEYKEIVHVIRKEKASKKDIYFCIDCSVNIEDF